MRLTRITQNVLPIPPEPTELPWELPEALFPPGKLEPGSYILSLLCMR